MRGLLLRDPRTLPASDRTGPCDVSVVVPARDEEATLPVLLASLHRSRARPREVIVVDDGSRDATAVVARATGARVESVDGPPPGWTGKAWAGHVGARAASGERLLFLDADTRLAPDALGGLIEEHERHGGLVSVQPHHRTERPYEQLSAYFNVVSVLACGAFGTRPRVTAFGPCLLTSRADYDRAGGHGAVRGEILDDVRLARAYARAGLPVRCLLGDRRLTFRMYPGGWRQLAEGWTKNIASGAGAAHPGPALLTVAWVAAHHAIAAGAVLALVRGDHRLGWAVAWILVALQLRGLLRRVGTFAAWTWLLFPVPLLAFDVLVARSLVRTLLRREVRWRGRDVPLRGTGPG